MGIHILSSASRMKRQHYIYINADRSEMPNYLKDLVIIPGVLRMCMDGIKANRE